MARARNLKPGLFKNEVLGVADPLLTLLFEGLWLLADRAGRLEDRPLRIKGEIFPYREGVSVDEMLSWLQENGFIRRYSVQGGKYIEVLMFGKHQNPHKNETESEIPAPEEETSGTEEIGATSEKIGSTRADSLSTDSLSTDSPLTEPSPAGRVCRLMKSKGISDVSPGNPDLLMLIEAGATDDEFSHAAEVAVKAGKRFSYALGVVKGKRTQAAEDAKKIHRGPMPRGSPKGSYVDQQRAQLAALTGARTHQGDVIDV